MLRWPVCVSRPVMAVGSVLRCRTGGGEFVATGAVDLRMPAHVSGGVGRSVPVGRDAHAVHSILLDRTTIGKVGGDKFSNRNLVGQCKMMK